MSGGVTTNYGLSKPDFNQKPWDGKVNGNWDLIDSILYTITQIPNIGGVWQNSTQYQAGKNVLDAQSLVFYQCVTSHVSAPSGLFAADRAANPTYWTVTSAGQGSVRYDQGQVLTSGQIQQALNNLAAFQTFLRFDAAQSLSYNQILQVLNTLLIDGTESILTAAATTDVGNAGSQNVRIDGTTSIISFGARPNKYKLLRFTDVLTLVNSASLILPAGQNIQTRAGDTCIATSDANNNWYIRAYQRADYNFGAGVVVTNSTITAVTGTFTNVSSSVRYLRIGKLVWVSISIFITTNGSAAGGVIIALPFLAAVQAKFVGREVSTTGNELVGSISANSGNMSIFTYNNTYPGGSGNTLELAGILEVV